MKNISKIKYYFAYELYTSKRIKFIWIHDTFNTLPIGLVNLHV